MTRITGIYYFWGVGGDEALAVSGAGASWEKGSLLSASTGSRESASPLDHTFEKTTMSGATVPDGLTSLVLEELAHTAALDAWAMDGGSFR